MGQQQLLLIVLTVVVVGLMVAGGIAMFTDQAAASNRDAISNDLVNFASKAQEYVRRPATLGGGGGSFMAFTLPGTRNNADGAFDISARSPRSIDIQGVGIELGYDAANPVKVVMTVTLDSVKVVEIN